jgi:chromosome segregation ATPase
LTACYTTDSEDITMQNYNGRIDEISGILEKTEGECRRLRRALGEKYVPILKKSAPDEDAATLLKDYQTIRERIEHSSSALERMIRIDERQTELRNSMREVQKELEQAESGRDLAGAYEAVGAAAFRLFREHPLVDATYSTAFSGVARYQDQIRRIDTQMEQIQTDPAVRSPSLLERLSRGSRQVILRNKRSVRENQLPGLLQKLGRDLATTDFFDAMDDAELTAAAEPIIAMENRKAALRQRIEELSDESRTLVEEFNALSGGVRLQKAQKNREAEIAASRDKLNEVLLKLGALAEEVQPEELRQDLEALENENSRVNHFSALLERLQAGKAAEEVGRSIDADNTRKKQIEERIVALQREIKDLDDEIRRKEQEKSDLLERRGDESELFGT